MCRERHHMPAEVYRRNSYARHDGRKIHKRRIQKGSAGCDVVIVGRLELCGKLITVDMRQRHIEGWLTEAAQICYDDLIINPAIEEEFVIDYQAPVQERVLDPPRVRGLRGSLDDIPG